MAWDVCGKINGGGTIPMLPFTVGSGGWTKGDPLVASAQTLIKATGGTSTSPIKWVAAETASAGAIASAIPLTPDTLIRVTGSGSPVLGTAYGVVATTCNLDPTNTTGAAAAVAHDADQRQLCVMGIDETVATTFYCVPTRWAS